MPYGTIRAVKQDGQYYCIGCASIRTERGKLSLKQDPAIPATIKEAAEAVDHKIPYSFEQRGITPYTFRQLVERGWLDIEEVLREGHSPDQMLLEEFACALCKRLLSVDGMMAQSYESPPSDESQG